MIAAMAQWEREEISERILASVPIRAKLGKPLGGQASFGYQWKDGKLIPEPKEAPTRRLMYELFLEHKRKGTVAKILNEMGYRTRSGSKFGYTSIVRLLRDPTAKGVRRSNYTKSLGDKQNWELKPEKDWVLHNIEPIISEELWNQCNHILDKQKESYKPPARTTVYLFAGLTYCECGGKMYVSSSNPKYTCQKCRNKISMEDLEGVFHEQLKSFFFSPTEVAAHLDKADETIREKEVLLSVLETERKKIAKDIDGVYELYSGDKIDKDGFSLRYDPLHKRIKQIEGQIPEVQGELDFLKIQNLSNDQIISEAKDLYTRWPSLELKEKRQVIENITEEIKIGDTEAVINLCYLPTSHEMASTNHRNNMD